MALTIQLHEISFKMAGLDDSEGHVFSFGNACSIRRVMPQEAASAQRKWKKDEMPAIIEVTGFEPMALCTQNRCATRLRYTSCVGHPQ